MNKNENLTDRDWEELASIFSGEKTGGLPGFGNGDLNEIRNMWSKMNMKDNEPVNVDKAWKKVQSRITEADEQDNGKVLISLFRRNMFLRIAASVIIIFTIGAVSIFLNRSRLNQNVITVVAGKDDRNLKVDLPDGSRIYLNRNSELRYGNDFGSASRNVVLTGEAFFDVTPDKSKPFIIDAGSTLVKVVGTSFNVLTDNGNSGVEVLVSTGKVVISQKSGAAEAELEPGIIAKASAGEIKTMVNNDLNYIAWNTGKLFYRKTKLDVVFNDLKRSFNMNIVADDPAIYDLPWTSPIDFESQDKIILLICVSFNLSYSKDGDVYHLSEK